MRKIVMALGLCMLPLRAMAQGVITCAVGAACTVGATLTVLPAEAQTVTLNWTQPTTRTDATPITGALSAQIWDTFTPAGDPFPNAAVQIGSAGGPPFTTGKLGLGSHSLTVIVCEAGGRCSAASNPFVQIVAVLAAPPVAVSDLRGTFNP
jgi:hypothetical protein